MACAADGVERGRVASGRPACPTSTDRADRGRVPTPAAEQPLLGQESDALACSHASQCPTP